MKNNWIFFLLLIFFSVSSPIIAAERASQTGDWWIQKFGVLKTKDDWRAARAAVVFEKVARVADKKSNRLPRLIILKIAGEPYAIALKDGSIVLTKGALEVCYSRVDAKTGDSRLAFITAHELAHLAKDDFWHSTAFANAQKFLPASSDIGELKILIANDDRAKEELKAKELQADAYGILYTSMAGYDPAAIVSEKGSGFFQIWISQITGKLAYSDDTHPSPQQRADFLRTQLSAVLDDLDYFYAGVRLLQLNRFDIAANFFEKFMELYPGREVFNNLGFAYYQTAMQHLSRCDGSLIFNFQLPGEMDPDTLAAGMHARGAKTRIDTSPCFANEEYQTYLESALENFEKAANMDPFYLPASMNLSSALIMSGQYSKAIAVLEAQLKRSPKNACLLNNKAVALHLFGLANNIDTGKESLKLLKLSDRAEDCAGHLLYNAASVQEDLGWEKSALISRRKFLELQSEGAYANYVRKLLGMDTLPPKESRPPQELKSPIPTGKLTKSTDLSGMNKKEILVGNSHAQIHEGKKLWFLVMDEVVEFVLFTANAGMKSDEAHRRYGKPLRIVDGPSGAKTHFYGNFAVDIVDGTVRTFIYF